MNSINVDSSLQVFTTIVSWEYYGVIWSLLVGSGIVFIPIVMQLVQFLLNARAQSSMLGSSSDGLLSALEVQLISLFLVMLFVALPASPFELNQNTVNVVGKPNSVYTDEQIPANASCGQTQTAYDDLESSDGSELCAKQSNIPIWWYGVLRVSHAITQATVVELTADTNHGFRALVSFARSNKIVNQTLQDSVNRFEQECYTKALNQNSRASTSGAGNGQGVSDEGLFGSDISWMGAPAVIELYENPDLKLVSSDPVLGPGLAFDPGLNPGVNTEIETPEAGIVRCADWWSSLYDQILEEATSEMAGDNRANRVQRFASSFNFIGANGTGDFLVRNYIQNSEGTPSQTTENIHALNKRSEGVLGGAGRRVTQLVQGEEFVRLAFKATFITDALIKALPILQAYILMFIVFMLPFGLVLSGFSWGYVIKASVLMFFVIFWSAIWGFAAWIDDSLAKTLWPGNGDGIISGVQSFLGIGTEQSVSEAMNKLIHSIVTAAMYLGGPTFAGWVLVSAGFSNVGNASASAGNIANLSVGGAGSAAGGSAVRYGVSATAQGIGRGVTSGSVLPKSKS